MALAASLPTYIIGPLLYSEKPTFNSGVFVYFHIDWDAYYWQER